jgi:hypothetical protein
MARLAREYMELMQAQMEFDHAEKKRATNTASSRAGPSLVVVKFKFSSLLDYDVLDGISGDDTVTKLL